MTLDEAIKHCLEVAKGKECKAKHYNRNAEREYNAEKSKYNIEKAEESLQCAADHRQLAEWLTELKEARQYLMEAVDGFRALGKYLDEHCKIDLDCDKCPLNNGGNCRAWKHTKAVMKLIGGI